MASSPSSHAARRSSPPRIVSLETFNPTFQLFDDSYESTLLRSDHDPTVHVGSITSQYAPVLPPIPRVASQYDRSDDRPQYARSHTAGAGWGREDSDHRGEERDKDLGRQLAPPLLSTGMRSHSAQGELVGAPARKQSQTGSPKDINDARRAAFPSFSGSPTVGSVPSRAPPSRAIDPITTSPNTLGKGIDNLPSSRRDSRSVSLAVPYAKTAASTLPTTGDRPVQAVTMINGVPQHARTSSPQITNSPQQKTGKRGLNLLNPVNLLMRRRSSQPQSATSEESPTIKSMAVPPMNLPDDYDPRIRGKVVHDFSAPKPKRGLSYNEADAATFQGSSPALPPSSPYACLSPHVPGEAVRPKSASSSANRRRSDQTMFIEHLDDDDHHDSFEKRKSAVRAEELANNDFISRVSQISLESSGFPMYTQKVSRSDDQQRPSSRDQGAARTSDPSSTSSRSEISALSAIPQNIGSPVSPQASPRIMPSAGAVPDESNEISRRPSQSGDRLEELTPDSTPRSPEPRPSLEIQTVLDADLPRHARSNASRFSFQMAGSDSIAEEKLLEERAKLRQSGVPQKVDPVEDQDEDEDLFDESAMYDHDELEDGDNSFDQDEMFTNPAMSSLEANGLGISHGTPDGISSPHILISPPVTRDVVDSSLAKDSQNAAGPSDPSEIQREDLELPPFVERASSDYGDSDGRASWHGKPHYHDDSPIGDEDDLARYEQDDFQGLDDEYHSGGMVDGATEGQEASFHENAYDDSSLLKDTTSRRKRYTLSPYDEQVSESEGADGLSFEMQHPDGEELDHSSPSDSPLSSPNLATKNVNLSSKAADEPVKAPTRPSLDTSFAQSGLTAYHSALAEAAQKAADSGRFSRQASDAASGSASSIYSRPSMRDRLKTGEDEEISRAPAPSRALSDTKARAHESYSGFDFGFNDSTTDNAYSPVHTTFPIDDSITPQDDIYDDDDFLNDDSIISEANADALASDDEGFYGQEFGFYARARSNSAEAGPVNGGFFGAPGIDMIERKWSLKEPNLTPITERSEFSTRNSYIGGPFSPSVVNMQSPAFAAQLARLSPLAYAQMQEDDVSLEQLMRARSHMMGGSEGSIRSSISSINGLALSAGPHAAPWAAHFTGSSPASARASRSQLDLMHTDMSASSPVQDPSSVPREASRSSLVSSHDTDMTPRKAPAEMLSASSPLAPSGKGRGHSRNTSSNSVTYVREHDAGGTDRWVLERRRTSEAGLVELVGREVVEGGRI